MIRGYLRWKRQLWRLQRTERRAYRAWYRAKLSYARKAYAEGFPAALPEMDRVGPLGESFREARYARMLHEGLIP